MEKSIRSIFNWANEKKIIQMNIRILSRILTKVQVTHTKKHFKLIQTNLRLIEYRRRNLISLFDNMKRKAL